MDPRYPPERLRGLVRNTLEEGETTRVHRVRAPAEVNSWFGSLSAGVRGQLLARLMAAEAGASAGVGEGAGTTPEQAPWPSQGQGRALLLAGVMPGRLSEYALAVVADLERGGVLVEEGGTYRLTVDGVTRPVRADTAYKLVQAGVLTVPEQAE